MQIRSHWDLLQTHFHTDHSPRLVSWPLWHLPIRHSRSTCVVEKTWGCSRFYTFSLEKRQKMHLGNIVFTKMHQSTKAANSGPSGLCQHKTLRHIRIPEKERVREKVRREKARKTEKERGGGINWLQSVESFMLRRMFCAGEELCEVSDSSRGETQLQGCCVGKWKA